ncbi:MAG: phage head closure protein [Desulfobacterales bacterium]|nr:phage head closure protein [Desulfobacterales bacterium]
MLGPKTELVLQKYTKVPDGMGGFKYVHQSKRKIKGVLIPLPGNERFVTGKIEVYKTHKFFMDYPKGLTVTEKDRFVLGDRTFDIKFVGNPAERNIHLEIELLEIQ